MFFANGYVETEQRRMPQCSNEENDILRELLLDGEFSSPHHFALTPSKPTTSSLSKRHRHVEVSIPQICFDNSTLLRSTPSLLNRNTSIFPSPSPSQQLPSSIINSIISPPRVFIQEFARFPPPFFHEAVSAALESEIHEAKQQPPKATIPFITSCLPPAPLPMLTMPPLKKKKTANSNSSERKQLRCSYPECPNLRRSAGFCNRHSGKVCSVSDCDKSALSRGKCPEHGGGSRCKKDGCSKFAQTRGLCKSHGGGRQCNISGCTKNAHQNRLCRSHGGGKRCDFYGCPKWAQRSGYCCAHTKMGPTNHGDGSMSAAPSPRCSAVPMPSPSLMSPRRLLSLLP